MRLTLRDGVATASVLAAVVGYALWSAGTVTMSARAAGGVVFALGWVACISDRRAMADVYGVGGHRRPHVAYVVLVSLAGAVALVAGALTIFTGSEAMFTTLVVSIVVLWASATVRHMTTHPTSGAPA